MNIVTEPGKFEGEPTYVIGLWDAVLEGASDEEIVAGFVTYSFVRTTEEEQQVNPDLKGIYGVALWEDGNGFVHHKAYDSAKRYQDAIAATELEAELDEQEDESI